MGGAEGDNAVKCTMNTHGTFSTLTYGGVGEPYDGDHNSAPASLGGSPAAIPVAHGAPVPA